MNAEQVRRLCDTLGLGRPRGEPAPVTGGFLHHMWRLETERGVFAVKDASGASRYDTRYTAADDIAVLARAHGIPAVVALRTMDSPVVQLAGTDHPAVIVYPWIEGKVLPPGPVALERAVQIGAVLAQLHALDASGLIGVLATAWSPPNLDIDELLLLARAGERLGCAWAADLRRLRPEMQLWYARYRQALPDLWRHQALSHCDLDQKNIIWADAETPWLIDWESAGMTNPTMELADVALNWSGVTVGEPDYDAFAAVIAAYRAHGGSLTDEPRDALYAVLINWLAWLRHVGRWAVVRQRDDVELRGVTDIELFTPKRLARAESASTVAALDVKITSLNWEVVRTLAAVARIAASLDRYASWLSA